MVISTWFRGTENIQAKQGSYTCLYRQDLRLRFGYSVKLGLFMFHSAFT